MVYWQIGEGATMSRRRKNNVLLAVVLLGILSATLVLSLCLLISGGEGAWQSEMDENTEASAYETSAITEVKPKKIDFQPVVDEWAKTTHGNSSIVIYDLERDEIVGEHNVDEEYYTASLYKLFVVYEGYLLVETGKWDVDDDAGATGYTVGECLDLAIRESNSTCAETLWEMIGENKLDEIIKSDFGITDSTISDFVATPADVAKVMQMFYHHDNITDEALITQMKDSFLNQPVTEYDWRQGLPSGFIRANVYNKVGWEYDDAGGWNVYHDAAIIEFSEENRRFVVIVMTKNIAPEQIRKLGAMIEDAFYKNT